MVMQEHGYVEVCCSPDLSLALFAATANSRVRKDASSTPQVQPVSVLGETADQARHSSIPSDQIARLFAQRQAHYGVTRETSALTRAKERGQDRRQHPLPDVVKKREEIQNLAKSVQTDEERLLILRGLQGSGCGAHSSRSFCLVL